MNGRPAPDGAFLFLTVLLFHCYLGTYSLFYNSFIIYMKIAARI